MKQEWKKLRRKFWVYWRQNEVNEMNELKEACLNVLKLEWGKLRRQEVSLSVLKIEWSKWNEQTKGSLFKCTEAIMKEIRKKKRKKLK